MEECRFESYLGSRNRRLKKPTIQVHVCFIKTILDLSNSSKCLYFHYTQLGVIHNFVTSIFNIGFSNSSLPIAFALSSGETKFLYDLFLQTVTHQLNIDFSNKIIESDEGPALHSIYNYYSINLLKTKKNMIVFMKLNI